MRRLALALVLVGMLSPAAWAQKGKSKKKDAPRATTDGGDKAAEDAAAGASESGGKGGKTKVLNFSGLDLEGKLKTPQLLYFLNRVRVELDSSTPSKRSFMKELERTADDKGL